MELPSFPTATDRRVPTAWAFSAEGAKVVHLIRHGQGVHNVAAALHGSAAYALASLADAQLDATGIAQARALGARIRAAHVAVDVVLVSPLTRTLQTMAHIFEGHGQPPAPGGGEAHPPPMPRMVAEELCREAFGG